MSELVDRVRGTARRALADAFLASLSTRRLDWRSAIGSHSVFRHLEPHAAVARDGRCQICGMFIGDAPEDLNVLNFERLKWGGVRHDAVVYALLDLRLFASTTCPAPAPDDLELFEKIVTSISDASDGVTAASIHGLFPPALRANKAERDVIVAILGFIGILETGGHPGFAERFVEYRDRELPPRRFVDMPYPACWWTASSGLNETRLRAEFGHAL